MTRHAMCLAAALTILACQGDAAGPMASIQPRASGVAKSNGETPFESFGCDREFTPGRVWQTGDILHVRGQSSSGLHLSTNPLVSGSIRVFEVNADINLSTGEGDFSGLLELTPTALDGAGSWRTHFKGSIPGVPGGPLIGDPPTLILSHMVAHGTGALAGGTLEFDHTANLAFAHPDFPAGCSWTGELFQGFVSTAR